jgi:hypothetical protein
MNTDTATRHASPCVRRAAAVVGIGHSDWVRPVNDTVSETIVQTACRVLGLYDKPMWHSI